MDDLVDLLMPLFAPYFENGLIYILTGLIFLISGAITLLHGTVKVGRRNSRRYLKGFGANLYGATFFLTGLIWIAVGILISQNVRDMMLFGTTIITEDIIKVTIMGTIVGIVMGVLLGQRPQATDNNDDFWDINQESE